MGLLLHIAGYGVMRARTLDEITNNVSAVIVMTYEYIYSVASVVRHKQIRRLHAELLGYCQHVKVCVCVASRQVRESCNLASHSAQFEGATRL